MNENNKTKKQLIEELEELRRRNAELEQYEIDYKKTEAHLISIFDSIQDGFFSVDSEWRFIYINAAAEKMLGINKREVLGRSHWEIFPLTIGTNLENEYRRAAAGEVRDFETFYQPGKRWFHNRCFPRRRGGMSVYFEDINENKLAEELTRINQEKFRVIFDNNAMPMAIIEPDTTFSMVNDAFCQTNGYTKEELVGMSWMQLIPSEHLEELKENQRRRLINPQDAPEKYEFSYRHKNGEIRQLIASVAVLPNSRQLIGSFIDITDRKRMEEALKKSEEKFRVLFENNAAAMAIIEPDMTLSMVNEAFCQYSGYTKKELVGMPWSQLIPTEHLEGLKGKHYKRLLNPQAPPDKYGFTYYQKNGEIGHLFASFAMIPSSYQIIGSFIDITEQMEIEDTLRKSEEKFRVIFENNAAAMAIIEPDTTFSMVNEALCQMSDYTKDELVGKSWTQLIPPEHIERLINISCDELKGIQSLDKFEIAAYHKNGEMRNVIASISLFPSSRQIICSFIDITERKRTEEALKKSEEKFRNIFENNAAAMAIIEPDTTFSMVNNTYCQHIGYSEKELLGMSWMQFIAEEDLDRLKEYNRKRLFDSPDVPSQYEYAYKHKSGAVRNALAHIAVIPSSRQIIASLVDITELKQAEEKIRILLEEKEMLLKEVHHRIRNNMNTMMSLLGLQMNKLADPRAVDALQDAKSRLQTMLVLYDRLYTGRNLKEMSIKEYLSALVHEIIRIFPNKEKVKVEINVEDFIIGIKLLSPLGIIINELVTNTMKHALSGKDDEGMIRVWATIRDRQATLIIEDNGHPIPESISFESSSGFGLGLVGLLIRQIDGTIKIDRNMGNRFILEFRI